MKIAKAIALALVSFTSCPELVQAQIAKPTLSAVRFVPPVLSDQGTPTAGRQTGSRRACPSTNKPLTALVPATWKTLAGKQADNIQLSLDTWQSVRGLTTSQSPTFWIYVPYTLTAKLPVTFVLQDKQHKTIYKTSFTAPGTQPSIVSFRLPPTAPLQLGKLYQWYFAINCNSDNSDRLTFVKGWVQRVALNPTLTRVLKAVTPKQRVAIYARNGIWHDALTTLAELRSANPGDAALFDDWTSLLHSIGLDAIAREPISQCCTSKN